jgi:4-alpha-glucanotransferase
MVLPAPRGGRRWRLLADSAAPDGAERTLRDDAIPVPARGVLVLAECPGGGASADPALLTRLAEAAGIAPAWWDVRGNRTRVGDDTMRALLAAMRLPATTQNEARDTLHGLADARDRRALPAALVVRGDPAVLALGLPAGQQPRAQWLTVARQDGTTERIRIGAEDGTVIERTGIDGRPARVWQVALPALPIGRHVLRRDDAPDAPCHVTVAPPRCYLPPAFADGGRRFGIAAQLYALRRDGDQGIGDLGTLAALAKAGRRAGAATIGINPLHMLFPESRARASPYHPSDRRFLDPIYIDVPEAGAVPAGELIDYPAVWAAKRAALQTRFAHLQPAEAAALDRFIAAGGADLHRFAVFQAIAELHPGTPWREWPAGLRAADGAAVAAFARTQQAAVRFHQYLQYRADHQLAAAGAELELGLFRDLAVGAAGDGAEAWAAADDLAHGAWIGAPPDPLAPNGQNWFLPPPIPGRRARDGFASFAALLAANMRHAGILRIDHVMGLSRLFWIPDGAGGADGAYVGYPLADLLGQVTLESVRAGCMVIGEDLGTVPDGLRGVLAAADVLSYRVLLLERDGRAFRPAAAYPRAALACVSTHDLPPLAGWLDGADLAERVALDLVPAGEDSGGERAIDRAALAAALGTADDAAMVVAAHALVGASPAMLAMAQTDDLAGARIGVNLPGTDTERANWRRRLDTPVDSLLTAGPAPAILDALWAGRLAPAGLVPGGDLADTGCNRSGADQPGETDRP